MRERLGLCNVNASILAMTNAAPQGTAAALETPSGKGAKDENFPVGSWLLPAAVRPHVTAFYDYVRAADDSVDIVPVFVPPGRRPSSNPAPLR